MYNNKRGVPQNNKGTSEKAVTLLQSAKCRDLDILQRVEGLGLGFRAQGMGVAQGSFCCLRWSSWGKLVLWKHGVPVSVRMVTDFFPRSRTADHTVASQEFKTLGALKIGSPSGTPRIL